MSAKHIQKNLAVMFTDISGFTEHSQTISRDALMERIETHNSLLMPIIAHYEGNIIKTIGDAFLITFESPTNAVQCGLFMQHTLNGYNKDKPLNDQIHIKVAINAGEVSVTDNDVFGDPVNVTAKIEKATNPDEIYFTEAVFLSMNKAEVPSAFVKHFRPKGEDSNEIKLYKVVQDENDTLYRKIVTETHINAEAVKERAENLSNMARKEFEAYQRTLETIIESQKRSSRLILIMSLIGVFLLAALVVIGFKYMQLNGKSEQQSVIESARAYLAADNPSSARELIERTISQSGETEGLNSVLKEITSHEIAAALSEARSLINRGDPDNALGVLEEKLPKGSTTSEIDDTKSLALSYIKARDMLSAGKCDSARREIIRVFGNDQPEGIKGSLNNCSAIAEAVKLLETGNVRDAHEAIAVVSSAFGDRTNNRQALGFLTDGLKIVLFDHSKREGSDKGRSELDSYRKRFVNISAWDEIRREVDLGGVWEYTTNTQLRRAFGNWNYSSWSETMRRLSEAGKDDPEFTWRTGVELNNVRKRLHYIPGTGMWEISEAVRMDPSLVDMHRAELKGYLEEWIDVSRSYVKEYRHLVNTYYYKEMKKRLISGLASKDRHERANSFAILAENGDSSEVGNALAFFKEHFDMFIEDAHMMGKEQWSALFGLHMSQEDYTGIRTMIELTLKDIEQRKGRWYSYTNSSKILREMLEDLKRIQPDHTSSFI